MPRRLPVFLFGVFLFSSAQILLAQPPYYSGPFTETFCVYLHEEGETVDELTLTNQNTSPVTINWVDEFETQKQVTYNFGFTLNFSGPQGLALAQAKYGYSENMIKTTSFSVSGTTQLEGSYGAYCGGCPAAGVPPEGWYTYVPSLTYIVAKNMTSSEYRTYEYWVDDTTGLIVEGYYPYNRELLGVAYRENYAQGAKTVCKTLDIAPQLCCNACTTEKIDPYTRDNRLEYYTPDNTLIVAALGHVKTHSPRYDNCPRCITYEGDFRDPLVGPDCLDCDEKNNVECPPILESQVGG